MLKIILSIGAIASEYAELEDHVKNLDLSIDMTDLENVRLISHQVRGYPNEYFKPSNTCADCVKQTAKCALDDTMKNVHDICEKKWLNYPKKFCDYYEEKPETVKGLMVYYISPPTIGIAFCLGKDKCTQRDISEIEKEVGIFGFNHIYDRFSELPQDDASLTNSMKIPNFDPAALTVDKRDDMKICIKYSGRGRWSYEMKQLIKWCREHQWEDPRNRVFCKWGGENPQQLEGFLLGAVDPYSYAEGYCKGKCGVTTSPEDKEPTEAIKTTTTVWA